jgi:hypothetical protein
MFSASDMGCSQSGREKRGTIHYEFADLITAEMMVGKRIDDEATVTEMFEKTLHLMKKITENSENFIAWTEPSSLERTWRIQTYATQISTGRILRTPRYSGLI